MASVAVQNPPASGESKSARKKKAKADAAANGPEQPLADPATASKEESNHAAEGDDGPKEHPYVSGIAKQIRNLNKKLSALSKSDAIVAENKGVSLDELVAQKKLNNDQRAALQKKPQIQQQLAEFQEQIAQYRKFDADYQGQLSKQKADLEEKHAKETAELREGLQSSGVETGAKELKGKLLIFSQFLRCAAAKRVDEANQDSPESKAFEGALLYVYGGDEVAVETALKVIEGSDEQVPSIDEEPLGVTFSQIKQTSTSYAPFQSEESWVESVAEANAATGEAITDSVPQGSDPTISHAGLNELSAAGAETNGVPAQETAMPTQGDAGDASGNAAGDRWDTTTTAGGAEKGMEDSFEMVPRPNDEVETPAPAPHSAGDAGAATGANGASSWADESTAAATGNQAGEGWDLKAAGQSAENATPDTNGGWVDGAADAAPAAPAEDGDGFQAVGGRARGGRGRGRGGDGEFRGRGRGRGGFRGGDGEFRGRGRGGFRGGRGGGEGGEFRGRGRGRGPRGDGPPRA